MAIPDTTNLISWWELTDLTDSHGSNDLTNNNAVTFVSDYANFVAASSQSLSHVDNADLSTGDIDYHKVVWFYLTTNGIFSLSAKGVGATGEYLVLYNSGLLDVTLTVYGAAGSSIGAATTTSNLSTGTWYMLDLYHSAADNEVGIAINGGTHITAATTGVPQDSTGSFNLGSRTGGSPFYFNGRMKKESFWKEKLSDDDRAWLYNAGAGRSYSELAPASSGMFMVF